MTTNTELVPVEQVDRDAAAELGRAIRFLTRSEAAAIKAGQVDTIILVQAFARHRLAAISLTLEEAAGVAEEVQTATSVHDGLSAVRALHASKIAQAIRALNP